MFGPGIKQKWLPANKAPLEGEQILYSPAVLASGTISYNSSRYNVDSKVPFVLSAAMTDSDSEPLWSEAEEPQIETADLENNPAANAVYAECSAAMSQAKNYSGWEKGLAKFLRLERPLTLYKSSALKVTSSQDESERDFRIRLQQLGNEERDTKVAALRKRYESKLNRLEARLQKAQQALQREEEQASGSKMDTALSIGTAVLGALLGRKRVSVTSASRAGTAARKAGNMRKQMGDVKRAEETIGSVQLDMEALTEEFDTEVAEMEDAYDAQLDELKEIVVRARSTNIQIEYFGIGWQPNISKA